MLISPGESPSQAAESLMATTYIVCSTVSIVKRQNKKRTAYDSCSRRVIVVGQRIFNVIVSHYVSHMNHRATEPTHLPDKVVERHDGPCDVQRRVERIRDKVEQTVFVLGHRCRDAFAVVIGYLPYQQCL